MGNKSPLVEVASFKVEKASNINFDDPDLRVRGIIQRAESKNANGRIYPKDILEQAINDYQTNFISINNALGELDHPDDSVVRLQSASHNIKKIWWEGNDVWGEIEIFQTPTGNILRELFKRKINVGISSRALGSVQQIDESTVMVEDDLELSCWDFVSTPSTNGAYMTPVQLNENFNPQLINKDYKIYKLVNLILNNQ